MDIKKMRACAPLLPPPGDEVVAQCLNEIERLRAVIATLEVWQAEGEALIENCNLSAAFSLGRWWADRPWRNRA